MKWSIGLCFLGLWTGLHSQDTIHWSLAGTAVNILRLGSPDADVLLYNMHDNENTAAAAGRIFVSKHEGTYFELMHNGKRNISFAWGEDSIHLDPNRIYTEAGIWQQLLLNKKPDTMALRMIKSWSDSLLAYLDINSRQLVIALHNNTNKGYSYKSYLPDGEYAAEAYLLYSGCVRDPDHFYFAADSIVFEKLSHGRHHTVLQDNRAMTDDGSLSVYCGQVGIPYVNVETQHGRLGRQMRMLLYAYQQLAP